MPGSIDIRRYADQWLDIFEWMQEHPEEDFIIQCDSDRKAHYTRFEFYRARKALEQDPGFKQIMSNVQKRKGILEGARLILRYADSTPVAELLKKSLEEKSK